MGQNAFVSAKGVTVVRQGQMILDDIAFDLPKGEITGLVGPSGSGKTTLMRALVGAQRITKGSITIGGLAAGAAELRTQIGYLTQSPAIYGDLTVRQNLRYFAAVCGQGQPAVARAIDRVDLRRQADQVASTLSGGQQARVSLAVALLGNAELLVLDEPTVGLDPVLRRDLWQLFAALADEGTTLLISTHVMDEAEQCPKLLLLREGRVLSHGTKQDLLRRSRTKTVEDAFLSLIKKVGGSSK